MNCLAFCSSSNAIQQWGRLFLRKTVLLYSHLEERKTMLVNPNYSWSTGVSNLSLSHQHNKCSRGCVKLEGLPGDRLWVLKELWLVKVIQFDSSLLMIREMLGLFPRLPIKSVCSACTLSWITKRQLGIICVHQIQNDPLFPLLSPQIQPCFLFFLFPPHQINKFLNRTHLAIEYKTKPWTIIVLPMSRYILV